MQQNEEQKRTQLLPRSPRSHPVPAASAEPERCVSHVCLGAWMVGVKVGAHASTPLVMVNVALVWAAMSPVFFLFPSFCCTETRGALSIQAWPSVWRSVWTCPVAHALGLSRRRDVSPPDPRQQGRERRNISSRAGQDPDVNQPRRFAHIGSGSGPQLGGGTTIARVLLRRACRPWGCDARIIMGGASLAWLGLIGCCWAGGEIISTSATPPASPAVAAATNSNSNITSRPPRHMSHSCTTSLAPIDELQKTGNWPRPPISDPGTDKSPA
jgi:hypothetical protein